MYYGIDHKFSCCKGNDIGDLLKVVAFSRVSPSGLIGVLATGVHVADSELIALTVVFMAIAILSSIVVLNLSSVAAVSSAALAATVALILSSMYLLKISILLLNEHLQGAILQVLSPWTIAMKIANKS